MVSHSNNDQGGSSRATVSTPVVHVNESAEVTASSTEISNYIQSLFRPSYPENDLFDFPGFEAPVDTVSQLADLQIPAFYAGPVYDPSDTSRQQVQDTINFPIQPNNTTNDFGLIYLPNLSDQRNERLVGSSDAFLPPWSDCKSPENSETLLLNNRQNDPDLNAACRLSWKKVTPAYDKQSETALESAGEVRWSEVEPLCE